MQHQSFTWKSPGGVEIFARHWPVSDPSAVVCLVHGLGEHTGRYEHVASFFTGNNIAMLGFDLPGFGSSAGKRGHTLPFASCLDEISAIIRKAENWYPDKPVFLYGQSMGGNLVLNFILEKPGNLAGVIASSPWIRLQNPPSAFLKTFAKITRQVFPSFTQSNNLDVNQLTTDPAVTRAYLADPLVHDRISVATGVEMLEAAARLDHFEGDLPVPVLLLHGSSDVLTSPDGTKDFAGRVSGDVTLKIWKDLKHELHNEPNKTEVMSFIVNWISEILGFEG